MRVRWSVSEAVVIALGVAALGACGPVEGLEDGAYGADGADAWRERDAAVRDDALAVVDAADTSDARDASAVVDASNDAAIERPFASIDWQTIGLGVSFKQSDDVRARNAAVLYAGYNITAASSRRWAEELYERWLRGNGVRFVYAVQGPAAVDYGGKEIANRALTASLVANVDASAEFVAVIAHSSGAYVAAEGFYRLFIERADRGGLVRDRVLYFDLDGDWGIAADPERNLSAASVGAMRWAYFIAVSDSARGLTGFNSNAMRAGQAMYPSRSEFAEYDARDSGCSTSVCLHLSLVNTRPLSDANQSYSDFVGRPVNRWYLDRAAPRLR